MQTPESTVDHFRSQSPSVFASAALEPEHETALDHPGEDALADGAAASEGAEGSADELDAETKCRGTVDDDDEAAAESDEDADERADGEDDCPDNVLPTIDLGTALENESKRQRAERIYLAHQVAGVELTRKNLTQWSGYQKAGSGRTAYVELERK
ncbi:hypothetical protein [Streptomyces sp. NPDC059651]|uniref:hypothetical protein n=1 Tax=Streptomyces sp. NPDC059651 TaxID=3346897 RepID=UPI0036A7CBB7